MALSVSFSFRWEPTAPRIMSDLAKKILQKRRDKAAERDWDKHKLDAIHSRLSTVFSDLMSGAKVLVDTLKARDPAYSALSYSPDNSMSFTVDHATYPSATIEVEPGTACVKFTTTIRPNSTIGSSSKSSDHIDVDMDENFNPVLLYRGVRLEGAEQALEIMLKPAIDR